MIAMIPNHSNILTASLFMLEFQFSAEQIPIG
jgi:hypothetical protein